ncbi:MAG: transaldolase [Acidobacteria bacterium]|nr:transaldolase [Acidobacteriota bacterium]
MSAPSIDSLNVRIFADGAELSVMRDMARKPWIKGFTTNPTLMRKAGVRDYRAFARDVLAAIADRPISFEVFSDDFDEMERQALEIASWGPNVNVKIPVSNTRGEFAGPLLARLSAAGVRLNVTAVMTVEQVEAIVASLAPGPPAFVSVFAGRIADTGRDPVPTMAASLARLRRRPRTELIWASPRELLNLFQADAIGCDVITVTDDILRKLPIVGRDLTVFSLETVDMFRADAVRAGYSLDAAGGVASTHEQA